MIYVHVPFCRSFCIYCGFYSELARKGADDGLVGGYVRELCSEIDRRRDETVHTLSTDTLYIGGGTPSVLPPSAFEAVVSRLACGPFGEFTVEVNPEDISSAGLSYVSALRDLGVNRISMGVQSLDDGMLRWMNRRHSAATARAAFGVLRSAGMQNVSVDIIFGISGMDRTMLRSTLDEILDWRPEHVSAYQLGVDDGSLLAEMCRSGRYTEAPEAECAGQYGLVCEVLGSAGYEHYEISNWALPGYRAAHNSAYWRRVPYVGFGPGAHSFDGRRRSWNSEDLSGWTRSWETLGETEAAEEKIMLGLRTSDGIPENLCRPEDVAEMLGLGMLVRTGGARLRIPEERWFVSDEIISRLV